MTDEFNPEDDPSFVVRCRMMQTALSDMALPDTIYMLSRQIGWSLASVDDEKMRPIIVDIAFSWIRKFMERELAETASRKPKEGNEPNQPSS